MIHDLQFPSLIDELRNYGQPVYVLTWNNHRWTFPSSEDRLAFRNYWQLQGEAFNFTKA